MDAAGPCEARELTPHRGQRDGKGAYRAGACARIPDGSASDVSCGESRGGSATYGMRWGRSGHAASGGSRWRRPGREVGTGRGWIMAGASRPCHRPITAVSSDTSVSSDTRVDRPGLPGGKRSARRQRAHDGGSAGDVPSAANRDHDALTQPPMRAWRIRCSGLSAHTPPFRTPFQDHASASFHSTRRTAAGPHETCILIVSGNRSSPRPFAAAPANSSDRANAAGQSRFGSPASCCAARSARSCGTVESSRARFRGIPLRWVVAPSPCVA